MLMQESAGERRRARESAGRCHLLVLVSGLRVVAGALVGEGGGGGGGGGGGEGAGREGRTAGGGLFRLGVNGTAGLGLIVGWLLLRLMHSRKGQGRRTEAINLLAFVLGHAAVEALVRQ